MMKQTTGFRRWAAACALVTTLTLAGGIVAAPASAQSKHHGILHRHPTATGAVAGVAAYKMAKHHRSGKHKNVFQKHPVLTGAAVGMAAHHHYKK